MNFTKHILVAGFQHETNTFAPSKADWLAFTSGASNPAYLRGEAMVAMHSTMRMPAGGFISAAVEQGWRVTGSCWAGAIPSAHVTEDAYERIAGTIVEDARAALQDDLDAIYIDFHGAAVAEHLQDPEGELLARLRAVVGPDLPIVVSLDMHANVSEEMLTLADALVAYRTYPHVDQYDTGKRAAILLERRFALGCRETTYWRRLNFLLPLNVQCTLMEPCLSIFAQLTEIEARKHAVASFTTGFPAADVAYCGPVVWAHGEAAREVVDSLFERIDEPRSQWRLELLTPDAAAEQSIAAAQKATRPILIADTQDNPGAGGDSNTTGLLRALLSAGAGRYFPGKVALGLMFDPVAASAAHAAGIGATVSLSLGSAVRTYDGTLSDDPVHAMFIVRALADGHVLAKGPMSKNKHQELGPCASLELDGILIAVSSGKAQMFDRELFRHVGIQPEEMKILVNKSSVHFRADFAPIADRIFVAKAKGPVAADPTDLKWQHLRSDMQLMP